MGSTQSSVSVGAPLPTAEETPNPRAISAAEIHHIAAGADARRELEMHAATFLRSNTRHKLVDVTLALAAYTFGGLMHIHGQGTALTSLSMWAAGTTFLMNMQLRKVFDMEDPARRGQVVVEMNLKEKNVFQLEMVASWVWMLAAMQQFKQFKRLKYCGYSSWTGLGCCLYFTLRHMFAVLIDE